MEIIDYAVKILFAVLGVLVTTYVVPWLKEKKLYAIVVQIVKAAEKLAENKEIDKKQYVIDILEGKGIAVDAYVDAIIEACVLELDSSLKKISETQTNICS